MPSDVVYGARGHVDVRVSWGNDESGAVQVVTQAVAPATGGGPTERILLVINEWLTAANMEPIDIERLIRATPPPFFDGWWATLDDWGQVNRLIKVLQRARDKAFGVPA